MKGTTYDVCIGTEVPPSEWPCMSGGTKSHETGIRTDFAGPGRCTGRILNVCGERLSGRKCQEECPIAKRAMAGDILLPSTVSILPFAPTFSPLCLWLLTTTQNELRRGMDMCA